jgi:hypothetical protein
VAHGKAPDRVRREDGTPVVNPASGIALDAAPARRPAVAAAMASLDPHRALAEAIVDFRANRATSPRQPGATTRTSMR